jgi:hypothetical protein
MSTVRVVLLLLVCLLSGGALLFACGRTEQGCAPCPAGWHPANADDFCGECVPNADGGAD